MKLISIGFGSTVCAERILAVIAPESAPIKRLIQEARERFEALIADDALLEYAEYVGNYYGTPLAPIREAIANGIDVVMDVEVVGALKIKKRLPEEAVLVFVTAPSFDIIRKRLVHRGDVAPGLMEERLERARWECSQAQHYDYIVINDDLQKASEEICAIMLAEKCKTMERIHLIKEELTCSTPQ